MQNDLWQQLIEALSRSGLLGILGGMVAYVYNLLRKRTVFSWTVLAANIFVAYWVGNLAGEFLQGSDHRDGLSSIAGYLAFPILDSIETKFRQWIKDKKI